MIQITNNTHRLITVLICLLAIIFGLIVKISPSFYYKKGLKFYNNQNYVKAYTYLKKAYELEPKNKDYRYYYVKNLCNLTPTISVQKEVFEIASGNELDSAQNIADAQVTKWRNTIFNTIGDNYIEQVPFDRGILRWDKNKFPLKFYIETTTKSNFPDYYNTQILTAIAQWQTSSGFIQFVQINNKKDADIVIKIADLPKNNCKEQGCKYVVGFTIPEIKGNLLKKSTITLYEKDPYGNFYSDKEIFNTVLHELGHALGIMGHSYSTGDLMYMETDTSTNFYTPYRSSFQYLSSKDINTLKLLYLLLPQITNTPKKDFNTKDLIYAPIVLGTSAEISSRKLEEAKNYIKNAPELSGGYVDLGVAYAELNKTADAVKAMKKAYSLAKTDNEKYLVCYNLSAIYVNSKHFKEALKYAKEAQAISNTEEIQDLITNIEHALSTDKQPLSGKFLKENN